MDHLLAQSLVKMILLPLLSLAISTYSSWKVSFAEMDGNSAVPCLGMLTNMLDLTEGGSYIFMLIWSFASTSSEQKESMAQTVIQGSFWGMPIHEKYSK